MGGPSPGVPPFAPGGAGRNKNPPKNRCVVHGIPPKIVYYRVE